MRDKDSVTCYLDGVHKKLLQACIVVGAKPCCFTTTGMVIVFTDRGQLINFKDIYESDLSWRLVQWTNAREIHRKYQKWIDSLSRLEEYKMMARNQRYPNLAQVRIDPLSCPEETGWIQLEQ